MSYENVMTKDPEEWYKEKFGVEPIDREGEQFMLIKSGLFGGKIENLTKIKAVVDSTLRLR